MKLRFNALDLKASLFELRHNFLGLRVTNIYDIDHKTYLIKLAKPDEKAVILIESGIRIHGTSYDWPKNIIPSGFSMKMRKHLKSRRLEKITQLGVDRIVDLQFGSGEAAYHLIVELYDKGNILLTDFEYIILNVLRPRTDENSDVRFAVKEKYPLHTAKQEEVVTFDRLKEILTNAKDNDLKKTLTSQLLYAAPIIEQSLLVAGFPEKCLIGKHFNIETDTNKLLEAILESDSILKTIDTQLSKGYIHCKKTKAPKLENLPELSQNDDISTYEEFHPFLFKKHVLLSCYLEFDSFDKAVDEFFSKLESQKLELKAIQQNKEAIKKLENVKKDHEKRIEDLQRSQTKDEINAKLIENNLELVDRALFLINNAIANQLDWSDINEIVEEAKDQGHPVASIIRQLKLDANHIVIMLQNTENEENPNEMVPLEIDLGLNAFKNAKKYYDQKKYSVTKEQKTIESSDKALRNAEKRTLETLKQAKRTVMITKSRKQYWFEKFYWFISSENYLVIGGRDQQQNEIIVKRHLKAGDLYVHADLHGASSVLIKNPSGLEVPPKTLNEASCMAVCYSGAWDAKISTNAWWVYHNQVSKQAPSGEYLTTGSFMIRGKKNYCPQTTLICGFALIYKLEEGSVARHLNERRVKATDEDEEIVIQDAEEKVNEDIENMIQELEKAGIEETDETNVEEVKQVEEHVQLSDEEKIENEPLKDENTEQKGNSSSNEEDDVEENDYPETNFRFQLLKDENIRTDKETKVEIDTEKSELNDQNSKNTKPYITRKQRRDMKKIKKDVESQVDAEGIKKETEIAQGGKLTESEDSESEKNILNAKEQQKQNKTVLKRGQKSKLAKIKQKYKDQDDEDRELIMQYLAPAGKKDKKKEIKESQKSQPKKQQEKPVKKKPEIIVNEEIQDTENLADEKDDDEEINKDELNVIDSLTGMPVADDELLFCFAMCAPYTAIQNYKHKVKITPGTSKKGQAVKTATEIFIRDKDTTQHEKDLIKALKDQDLSRNLPGKVKVSAPNLMKIKKKK